MTKCLLKALKAVDLHKHAPLFRSLGYDSAGALAHFRAEHFERLNLNEQELLRLIALLDVLKEATREGKICPHYFNTNAANMHLSGRHHNNKQKPIATVGSIRATWSDESTGQRNSASTKANPLHVKQSIDSLKPKRSISSLGITARTSSATLTNGRSHSNGLHLQRPSTVLARSHQPTSNNLTNRNSDHGFFGSKSFSNRPSIQHVKVKSYNYGVPTSRRPRSTGAHRVSYQHESSSNHGTIFTPSSHSTTDLISYAKPAEIYVYARKRPLLSTETNFQDSISVPDNKRLIVAENKANLDCTPLLKKTEFQFDQVFGADVSNWQVFEHTVLPFISTTHRHNLTYICFGQTGSGKSHTMFGSKTTDGLLIYCAQLLLRETSHHCNLTCSFYEIYNNQVYDLSNAGKRLFVREDGEHHVNVIGVTETILHNLDELHFVIDDGLSRRHHGKSAFNSNSSRSHAVFQITLKNSHDSSNNFRLVFIDLAGSERATDAQNNQRQTRREGAQINWSLLALKECIRSMDMTHSHAPFRQSKLTHILRDSLVGSKTRTCLMANVSPADDCCQCSLNTLLYASRIRDISMRHRHRSIPVVTNSTKLALQIAHTEDNINDDYHHNRQKSTVSVVREKPQRTFKPATASTPVHRLMSAVDHRVYMAMNHADGDARAAAMTTTKPVDIDWQIADDDVPITGGGHPLKSLPPPPPPPVREFNLNTNNSGQTQSSSSYYLTRFHPQQRKENSDTNASPSSYFPASQSDLTVKSATGGVQRQIESLRLMYDNGNERQGQQQQWKSVAAPPPPPPLPTSSRLSDSSIEPPSTTRIIPVAPVQISDDNPYSSTTGTESLGAKITKMATNSHRYQTTTRLHTQHAMVEDLNLNQRYHKPYDPGATTVTTDTDQALYSDRQATHRDQTGFFTHRDDPLYGIVATTTDRKSSRSTTHLSQAPSSVTPTSSHRHHHHHSNVYSGSSYSHTPSQSHEYHRKSLSPPSNKRNRPIKSVSSSASLVSSTSQIYGGLDNDDHQNSTKLSRTSLDEKQNKFASSTALHSLDTAVRRSPQRHHHRTAPVRARYSSDSEEPEIQRNTHRRKAHSSKNTSTRSPNDTLTNGGGGTGVNSQIHTTRSEACQTTTDLTIMSTNGSRTMRNQQEQTDDDLLLLPQNGSSVQSKNHNEYPSLTTPNPTSVPPSSSTPHHLMQAPLDQIKRLYQQSETIERSPMPTNINNPWPTSPFASPSINFGVRVSDQLNALRTLLETRLMEQDESIQRAKEPLPPSSLTQDDVSQGRFAREFLRSFRESSLATGGGDRTSPSRKFLANHSASDDEDQEVARNFNSRYQSNKPEYEGDALSSSSSTSSLSNQHHDSLDKNRHRDPVAPPSLSSLSNELNQPRVSTSATVSSTATITSNLAAKIDRDEPRALSSPGGGIRSHHSANDHQRVSNGVGGSVSLPTSDSERTSQVNSTSQNPFTGTSSGGSSAPQSRPRSPLIVPPLDIASGNDHLFDSGKGSSLLTGSSFNVLMNSLKNMREKDLDFGLRTGDETLIRVAD